MIHRADYILYSSIQCALARDGFPQIAVSMSGTRVCCFALVLVLLMAAKNERNISLIKGPDILVRHDSGIDEAFT